MQKLKKVLLRLLLVAVIFIGSAIGLAAIFEDDVKQFAVRTINTYIQSEVKVANVEFSFLKKFPSASLEFQDVLAYGTTEATKNDPLFQAKSIFLAFDIWEIIQKNYSIKKLSFENGLIHLQIDQYGNENYIIWKTTTDSAASTDLHFSLNEVKLQNVHFIYENKAKNVLFDSKFSDLALKGEFTATEYELDFNTDFQLYRYEQNKVIFADQKAVNLSSKLAINSKTGSYTITDAAINYQGLPFELAGNLVSNEAEFSTDLTISSGEIPLVKLIQLLPEQQRNTLAIYQIDGSIVFDGLLKGKVSDLESPSIRVNYVIKDGSFLHQETNIALNEISLIGTYGNGSKNSLRTSFVKLENIDAKFGTGSINGSLAVTDFNDPSINFNGNLQLVLAEVLPFMNVTSVKNISGEVAISVATKGRIGSLNNFTLEDWKKTATKGEVILTNVGFELVNNPQSFKDISGTLTLKNNDVKATALKGNISRSDFKFNGMLYNAVGFLFSDDEPLRMDASLRSKRIFLDELLLSDETTPSSDSAYQLEISDRISLFLDSKIDSLSFRKFSFSNCTAFIGLQNKQLKVTNVFFNTMEGTATGNLIVNTQPKDKIIISSDAILSNISISQLFTDFGNFGQQTLTSDNIKGKATCDIEFYSEWSKDFELNPKSLEVQADLNIEKGELINFASIEALSDYVALSDLKHIKFATLSNQIIIKNERIFIPTFDINSTALNLKLEGSHSFNNDINYRIELLLNDILGNKAREARKRQSEFGQIEDDGLGKTRLFMKMTGNLSDPDVSYNTGALKNYWKEGFKKEKKAVKSLLKEEFGLFKKDTTVKTNTPPPLKKQTFEMEWDEAKSIENSPQKETPEEKKKKEKKNGLGKFLDKISQPNEEEFE